MSDARRRLHIPRHVKIGAVLPQDNARLFSIGRVKPAASIAVDKVIGNLHLLPRDTRLTIEYKDSQCSEAVGMNEVINFYIKGGVNVFFGPVCDYAAAPVARQTRYWNVPMLSVGAIALDFLQRRKDVYSLLTRAGPANLINLAQSFVTMFHDYKWTGFKVLYEREGHSDILHPFCHLASEALVYGIKKEANIKLDYYRLVGNRWSETIKNEVGNTYSGRSTTPALKIDQLRAL